MNSAASNPITAFIPYVAIVLIFYFIVIRPGQQQRKKHEQSIRAIKKGDEVVTAGGIIGEIVHIKTAPDGGASETDRITIRSGEARIVVERGRISKVITPVVQEAPKSASGGNA